MEGFHGIVRFGQICHDHFGKAHGASLRRSSEVSGQHGTEGREEVNQFFACDRGGKAFHIECVGHGTSLGP